MGTSPNKYHVTDSGDIYRIDENGEVTEIGNVDALSDAAQSASERPHSTPGQNADVVMPGARYSLHTMETMLCEGRGRGFNKGERRLVASESQSQKALIAFVKFAGSQWINKLVQRYEKGEEWLEPVLLEVSQNKYAVTERMALCKRRYTNPEIYRNMHGLNLPRITHALITNPQSPYYDPEYATKFPASKPRKDSGGCFGVILFLIITISVLAL